MGRAQRLFGRSLRPSVGSMGPISLPGCPEQRGRRRAEPELRHLQPWGWACVHQEAPPGLGATSPAKMRVSRGTKGQKNPQQRRKSS